MSTTTEPEPSTTTVAAALQQLSIDAEFTPVRLTGRTLVTVDNADMAQLLARAGMKVTG